MRIPCRVPQTLAGALLGALLALSPSALQRADANGDTRTLSFVHTHVNERVTVTFKRDGRYDPEGLRQLNHFLRDWRRGESTTMDPRVFDLVWEVARDVGATEPLRLVSAYRSPTTNNMLRARSTGVARESQHTRGKAIDFFIPGVSNQLIRERAMLRQAGGVGYYAGANGFVHVDVGSVRAWPRLPREHLARLFPDGETLHLPASGPPLSGTRTMLARRQAPPPVVVAEEPTMAYASAQARDPAPSGRRVLDTFFADEPATTGSLPPPPPPRPRAAAPAPATASAPVPLPLPRPRFATPAPLPAHVEPTSVTLVAADQSPAARQAVMAEISGRPVQVARLGDPLALSPMRTGPEVSTALMAARPATRAIFAGPITRRLAALRRATS